MDWWYFGPQAAFHVYEPILHREETSDDQMDELQTTDKFPRFPNPLTMPMAAARFLQCANMNYFNRQCTLMQQDLRWRSGDDVRNPHKSHSKS